MESKETGKVKRFLLGSSKVWLSIFSKNIEVKIKIKRLNVSDKRYFGPLFNKISKYLVHKFKKRV